jgi:hypothetical protein
VLLVEAGVVDEARDGPAHGHGGDGLRDGGLVGHVADEAFAGGGLPGAGEASDLEAAGAELPGDGGADAAVRTGDDDGAGHQPTPSLA